MASTLELLKRLANRQVEFVVVGGLAGVAHGSAIVTQDVDVCAVLDVDNARRLLAALDGTHPRWRTNPNHPPLTTDPHALAGFNNLYLLTDLGQIDVLSEIAGLGPFTEVRRRSTAIDVGGVSCRVLSLDALIDAKRALGRPRDLQAAIELEAIRERAARREPPPRDTP